MELIKRCLTRDRKQRLQAIGEARIAIDSPPAVVGPRIEAAPPPPPAATSRLPWILAAAALTAAGVLAFPHFRSIQQPGEAGSSVPARFILSTDAYRSIDVPAVSPDGQTIAFFATLEGKDQRRTLFLRPLDSLSARPLAEAEGAGPPIWSPNSRAIAFLAGNQLKRVAVDGPATAETIATVNGMSRRGPGGSWSPDGDILIGGAPGIFRVNSKTGSVTQITSLADGASSHIAPAFLPGGRHFLFIRRGVMGAAATFLGDVDASPATQPTLLEGAFNSTAWVPGDRPGTVFLIGVRDSLLMAQRVDVRARKVEGRPFVLDPTEGDWLNVTAAANGAVAMWGRKPLTPDAAKWLDRKGRQIGAAVGEPGVWGEVQLTRDGSHALMSLLGPPRRIRVLDLERNITRPLDPAAPSGATDYAMAVSPDSRVAFSGATSDKPADIYWKPLNGGGAPERLFASPNTKHPNDWSYDGRFLMYDDHHFSNRQDLWIIPLEGESKPYLFLGSPADETLAQFSPDGKWIAYQSDETGRSEVYVQAFSPGQPASGAKWQISSGGGAQPRWRRDGQEIFYLASRPGKMMAVPIRPGSGAKFNPGVPVALFDLELLATGGFSYDVSPDGARFLVNRTKMEATTNRVAVLTNVLPALARQAAAANE